MHKHRQYYIVDGFDTLWYLLKTLMWNFLVVYVLETAYSIRRNCCSYCYELILTTLLNLHCFRIMLLPHYEERALQFLESVVMSNMSPCPTRYNTCSTRHMFDTCPWLSKFKSFFHNSNTKNRKKNWHMTYIMNKYYIFKVFIKIYIQLSFYFLSTIGITIFTNIYIYTHIYGVSCHIM